MSSDPDPSEEEQPFDEEEPQQAVQALPDMPVETIREKILNVVREKSVSIAAGLEKAEKWDRQENRIILSFSSPFASTLVEKESHTIEAIVKSTLDWDMKLVNDVKRAETVQENTVEEQVELIRSVFRGTVI